MAEFTHFNEEGRAKMVDVSEKPETFRTAICSCQVLSVNQEIYEKITNQSNEKGRCFGSCSSCRCHGGQKNMGYYPDVSSAFPNRY